MEADVRKRALVFDDEADIRQLFKLLLEMRGYEVETFADATPFCAVCQGSCPLGAHERCADLVISDIRMPRYSGIDLVTRMLDRGCHIPKIALMSGYWTETTRKDAARLGCHTFAKPMRVEEIFAWLDAVERDKRPPHLTDRLCLAAPTD